MIKVRSIAMLLTGLLFACSHQNAEEYSPPQSDKFIIDGQAWVFILKPTHCERYIQAAIQEYLNKPIYNINRPLEASRFLINEKGECWVDVDVDSDTFSFLFRVDEQMNIVDKRMFSNRRPHIQDYPSEPFEK